MSKLKVLLVNPPVFQVNEPWYDTPDFVRTSIAYIAAYLRDHIECEIMLVDSKFERLGFPETVNRIEQAIEHGAESFKAIARRFSVSDMSVRNIRDRMNARESKEMD